MQSLEVLLILGGQEEQQQQQQQPPLSQTHGKAMVNLKCMHTPLLSWHQLCADRSVYTVFFSFLSLGAPNFEQILTTSWHKKNIIHKMGAQLGPIFYKVDSNWILFCVK